MMIRESDLILDVPRISSLFPLSQCNRLIQWGNKLLGRGLCPFEYFYSFITR